MNLSADKDRILSESLCASRQTDDHPPFLTLASVERPLT